jgi:uncharacterized protein with PIN domain
MAVVEIQCYGELNDFLPQTRRERTLRHPVADRQGIKDVIEALGVPHPEIGLLLANGAAVDFGYSVHDGDALAVYPAYSDLPLPVPSTLRPPPAPRFVLDVHLGRLAEYLRRLGFDTLYRNDYDDPELAEIAGAELRILLTRDLGLLKRGRVVYGAYVRSTDPEHQVVEIVRRFRFWDAIDPFRRCSRCNGLLVAVARDHIAAQLLPQTRADHTEFHQCQACGQLYWPGSHFERLLAFVDRVRAARPV